MTVSRVVVVDDHQMFAEALTAALAGEPDLWAAGHTTPADPDLPAFLLRARPDIVTVDVETRDTSVRELLGRIQAAAPLARVVVLTGSSDLRQVVDAARAGAVAWLSKGEALSALVGALCAVAAGEACYPAAHLGPVLLALRADVRAAGELADGPSGPLATLSRQERRVLAGMVQGISGAEIAAELRVSVGTVRSHTSRVFTKLGVHSRLEAVRLARTAGMSPSDLPPSV